MRATLFFLLISLLAGCSPDYNAKAILSESDYNLLLTELAPYVVKKPDEFSYEERFNSEHQDFYKNFLEATQSEIRYFNQIDTATFFFFCHKDLTSLYEHYRGLGGYFRQDNNKNIVFLNILYHTPRFTKAEMDEKGLVLFNEMVDERNVDKYIGNKKFVHTPNDDFFYNTKLNRWDYTPNSSWKFLEEAREITTPTDSTEQK
jgi:hypothetical protein